MSATNQVPDMAHCPPSGQPSTRPEQRVRRSAVKHLPSVFVGTLALLLSTSGLAAAQTAVTRIVYEECQAGSWDVFCSIGLAVDGSETVIANGVGPKWSPDGSRIAFTG